MASEKEILRLRRVDVIVRALLAMLLFFVFASAAASAATSPSEQPKFIIGGQFAYGPEGEYVIEQMKNSPGTYSTAPLPAGRTLHILDFDEFPGIRFVYAETRQGMENAASLSTLMANFPDYWRPHVVIHAGISGNAGDGDIGDVYLNRYFVLGNLQNVTPQRFTPRPNESYNPDEQSPQEIVYFPADRRLIAMGERAFAEYSRSSLFQELQAQLRSTDNPIRVHTNTIGASSNWFVADERVIDAWRTEFSVRPPVGEPYYQGENFYQVVGEQLPLGTIDMETAAAAKIFYEHGIPFAAASYPSNSAMGTALDENESNQSITYSLGGGFVWQWVREIAAYADEWLAPRLPAIPTTDMFQYATITDLHRGAFAGGVTVGELKQYGGWGLGAVADLDGEMIAVDGTYYRADTSGALHELDDDQTVAFASVINFRPQATFAVAGGLSLSELEAHLQSNIDPNAFYAVRLTGTFRSIKARSVPKQQLPYPSLGEVIEQQSVFEFSDQDGVLVGFYTPPNSDGLYVPGLHAHFVTGDRTMGGHILDLVTDDVSVEIMRVSRMIRR